MIEDFYLEPEYWIIMFSVLLLFRLVIGFRAFDFKFLVCLFFSQYVAHITLAFGISIYLIFCLLFIMAFVAGYHACAVLPNLTLEKRSSTLQVDLCMARVSKLILIAYYGWRLFNVPILAGPLDLAKRLELQQESRAAFFLSIVMLPPFVACMLQWLRERRFGTSDWVTILLTVLGSLVSGSKASILPLVLIYVGVSSYLGRGLRVNLKVAAGVVLAGMIFTLMLLTYFPLLSLGEIGKLILFRVVANTDNIEYLYASGVEPSQYPFAGIAAIVPFIGKHLGAQIDYPYGVWLHGMRYADWSGFGPNAGFIIEQFGNLGWIGVCMGAVLGLLVRWTLRVQTTFRVMILSFCHVFLIESTAFFLNLFFCVFVLIVAYVLARIPWREFLRAPSRRAAADG